MNKLTALVVDDAPSMRRLVVAVLRDMEIREIQEADNGQSALKRLAEHPIDFVITDWKMPVMDGLGLLKAMRADPRLKDTPVLVLTSAGAKETVIEALQNGANNFLVKPFTQALLEKKVAQIVGLIRKNAPPAPAP